jgi:Skp family chaperone for outer membrane proteins
MQSKILCAAVIAAKNRKWNRNGHISKWVKFIKAYGKKKGYSYIYGTGDAASVLYAEDKYDITKISY